jgi:hypothetical protein
MRKDEMILAEIVKNKDYTAILVDFKEMKTSCSLADCEIGDKDLNLTVTLIKDCNTSKVYKIKNEEIYISIEN